ncbi:MAG TPA: hypothetical protein VFQ76_00955 [Longimicrobiaceae bacterium]|nr:hypothetical protein [Longimicrobiaceae bacterium]
MKKTLVRLGLVALAPLLAACPQNPLEDTVCTMEARSAVTVELRDARTGAALTGPATMTVRDGAFVETAEIPAEFSSMGVAHERAGVYVVTVKKAGYRDWTRADVAVKSDECHVQTAVLRAELEPTT